jgi:predicted permease
MLKSGTREGTYQRSRARSGLLVLQGSLSVLLLVGAGLFVRSFNRVREVRLGYEPDAVLVVMRNLRGTQLTDTERVALSRRLVETARAIPGVEAAADATSIPFWSTSSTDLFVTGIDSVRRLGRFTLQQATPEYFHAMQTRILRGRSFTESDRPGTQRVVVVSEAMARTLWPGRDALGECIRMRADTMPCTTVVGIAENAVQNDLANDPGLRYYLPLQQDRPAGGNTLLIRTRGEPAAMVEPVRKALQAEMPGLGFVSVFPMREIIADEQRSWQMGATMFVAFGGLALLVAAVGLYGVIAYNVAQRMHELGVRIALGARSEHVVRLVVQQGVRFAGLGVVIGLAIALGAAPWIEPLLFRQPARDPVTYSVVAAVLLLVALIASAVPALRATKADPNAALRSD